MIQKYLYVDENKSSMINVYLMASEELRTIDQGNEPSSTQVCLCHGISFMHDDVIKWKHFPCYWPFVRGIHWWLVDSPAKCQWHRVLMFSICTWTNGWVNSRDAGGLRCHGAHYDITVMGQFITPPTPQALDVKTSAVWVAVFVGASMSLSPDGVCDKPS